jgi:hypothetical protein
MNFMNAIEYIADPIIPSELVIIIGINDLLYNNANGNSA